MTRTIISLHIDDKIWIQQAAKTMNISMAQFIRQAIRKYRQFLMSQQSVNNEFIIEETD